MPNAQSKLSIYQLIPAKYIARINLELQRTFMIVLSLLKTHRRKAFLLSLGPSTILKFVTVILPIIKIMPTLIKTLRTLSYFTKSNSNNNSNSPSRSNSFANRDTNRAGATDADGISMSMDELNEILWTPAEDMYWERVNAMVTRFGLCKTLGITLAGVRPGRVEVLMPFRAEVSASLFPTLIALTSQLTGMTLLPRYFTLKPIDFKCNILSDCDASTYLLVGRGAVVVRGDHSITVKVEILKASGSAEVSTTSPSSSGAGVASWRTWIGASTVSAPTTPLAAETVLVPGTGIERSKLTVCASGTQTSVVIRAGTDTNDEEEKEMHRLRKERDQHLQSLRKSSSASSSTSSLIHHQQLQQQQQQSHADPVTDNEIDESAIIFGDSIRLGTSRTPTPSSPKPLPATIVMPVASSPSHLPGRRLSSDYFSSASSIVLVESTERNDSDSSIHHVLSSIDSPLSSKASMNNIPILFGSAMRQEIEVGYEDQEHHQHNYDMPSDTEAWQ
ncbi:hypothetical protein BGZ94_007981 [Podila epigama]|nr:hypothetical protein BGZ94_007981 [Podila epigama]